MNSVFRSIITAAFFFLIYACSPTPESAKKALLDFQVEKVTIPIGPEIDPYTMSLQYVEGDLFWHNKNRSTISKINLNTKQVSAYFHYQEEGPLGVGNIDGFYLFNQNKVAFPASGRRVSIYDMNTDKVDRIKLSDFVQIIRTPDL